MNDVSPELLTLGITHDSSLALVLYLCWFIIMPDVNTLSAKDGDLRLSASNACLPKTEISVFVME